MNSKIEFTSFLADYFEDYLMYREDVGYTYRKLRWFVSTFDRFVLENGVKWKDLDPALLLLFRDSVDADPGTVNKIFILLRGFFDYLVRMDLVKLNPAVDIPSMREKAYIPFIFSPDEVERLLKAAEMNIRKKEVYDFIKRLAVYTAIFLMARCGLRISEPVRLKCGHYRHDDKTLYIEKTKFNKDRLIPVPRTAWPQLENYISFRNRFFEEEDNPNLLATDFSSGVSQAMIYNAFHKAVNATGLKQAKQDIGNMRFGHTRPHSLRHSFAVNTLKAVRQRGGSAQNALPVLAAYLGHSDYRYTMKYLKVLDAGHRKALVDFSIFRKKRESI